MAYQDYFRLIGILIVVAGFALRLRTTSVVVAAALATGLVAGLPLLGSGGAPGIIDLLGRAFAENRLMTLFIMTLPAIGLAERHGLQAQAAALIRRVRVASAGRLQIFYQLFRIVHGAAGLRLNGHPSFVRPLLFPMSIGAAANARPADRGTDPSADDVERIKAASAAAENYGNFYGQNLSPVQPGVLLVYGVMQSLGHEVSVFALIRHTTPIVLLTVVIGAVQFYLLDRRLAVTKAEER
jgi:uncharacterized membrane protein